MDKQIRERRDGLLRCSWGQLGSEWVLDSHLYHPYHPYHPFTRSPVHPFTHSRLASSCAPFLEGRLYGVRGEEGAEGLSLRGEGQRGWELEGNTGGARGKPLAGWLVAGGLTLKVYRYI